MLIVLKKMLQYVVATDYLKKNLKNSAIGHKADYCDFDHIVDYSTFVASNQTDCDRDCYCSYCRIVDHESSFD